MKMIFQLMAVAYLATGLSAAFAQGAPMHFGFDGVLLDQNGAAVTQSAVNFKVEILDPSATCVLYVEEHLNKDLSNSNGAFSIKVGSMGITGSNKVTGTSFISGPVFENPGSIAAFPGCASGVTLPANAGRLLRVSYDLGQGYLAFTPDFQIGSVPYAMVADSIGGKRLPDLVQVRNDSSTKLTQANLENIFSTTNYPRLNDLLSGSGSLPSFSGSRLTNLGAPLAGADAANKVYVDSSFGGKSLDISSIGPAIGDGRVLTWDGVNNKWTTSAPNTDGSLLSNVNATRLVGRNVATITPANDQVLKFNAASNTWVPAPDLGGISALSGDVSASGSGAVSASITPGAVTTGKIADGAVTFAKINPTATPGVNRLIATNSTDGNTLVPFQCPNFGDTLKWDSNGWACNAPVVSISPWVTSGSSVYAAAGAKVGIGTTVPWSDFHVRGLNGDNLVFAMNPGELQVGGASNNSEGAARLKLESNSTFGSWVSMKGNNRYWYSGVGGSNNWPATMTTDPNDNVQGQYFIFDETSNQLRMVIDQMGNVGIGTASPAGQLTVARIAASPTGDQRASVSMISAEAMANSDLTQKISASNAFLKLMPMSTSAVNYNSLTGAEGAVKIGAMQTGTVANVTGQRGVIMSDGGMISDGTGVDGGIELSNINAAAQANLFGVRGRVSHNGTGTVGSASALSGFIDATGPLTNAYGAKVSVGGATNAIQNGYGVYIENVMGSQAKYSLYAQDPQAPSYFAGKVGIGTTSPVAQLDVLGSVSVGRLMTRVPQTTISGTGSVSPVTAMGSSTAGTIQFFTGTTVNTPTSGSLLASISVPHSGTSMNTSDPPICVISPTSPGAASVQYYLSTSISPTNMLLSINYVSGAITQNTPYSWAYHCIGKM